VQRHVLVQDPAACMVSDCLKRVTDNTGRNITPGLVVDQPLQAVLGRSPAPTHAPDQIANVRGPQAPARTAVAPARSRAYVQRHVLVQDPAACMVSDCLKRVTDNTGRNITPGLVVDQPRGQSPAPTPERKTEILLKCPHAAPRAGAGAGRAGLTQMRTEDV